LQLELIDRAENAARTEPDTTNQSLNLVFEMRLAQVICASLCSNSYPMPKDPETSKRFH
jgi:hypothetical protein